VRWLASLSVKCLAARIRPAGLAIARGMLPRPDA